MGQLFCDHTSKDVLRVLAEECRQCEVSILTHCEISAIAHEQGYVVTCNKGEFSGASLVVATGGLSIPKMGASDLGYRVAKQFGLRVHETRAGLVPFMFSGPTGELMQRLSGVSLAASVTVRGVTFTESVLFTHRGLSGPAVLQSSSYWRAGGTPSN